MPQSYPSDLTNDQWSLLEALLPSAKPGGQPRTVDLREDIEGHPFDGSEDADHLGIEIAADDDPLRSARLVWPPAPRDRPPHGRWTPSQCFINALTVLPLVASRAINSPATRISQHFSANNFTVIIAVTAPITVLMGTHTGRASIAG